MDVDFCGKAQPGPLKEQRLKHSPATGVWPQQSETRMTVLYKVFSIVLGPERQGVGIFLMDT